MMGRGSGDQASLFYEFRLDDRVPKNHLLRRINIFVTPALADVHEQLDPYYSEIGRPSIDPELMIRMLIVGYCYRIRSERRLCAGSPLQSGISLVSLGGHGLSTPFLLSSASSSGKLHPDEFMLLCVLGVWMTPADRMG